ncbi:MAG: hypothetical protein AAF514_02065, partial [Verrucomicrobiota bacterium]
MFPMVPNVIRLIDLDRKGLKIRESGIAGAVWLSWMFVVSPVQGTDEIRTWTSARGSAMEAKLVGFDGRTAKLETPAGKTITVTLAQLSKADRHWL